MCVSVCVYVYIYLTCTDSGSSKDRKGIVKKDTYGRRVTLIIGKRNQKGMIEIL